MTKISYEVIQLAKLSGFSPIITTASLHNSELLEGFGATHVIDRKADVPEKVAEILKGTPVQFIYDAVANKDTQEQAWDLLSPGGTLVLVQTSQLDKDKYKDKVVYDQVFANVHTPQLRQLGISLYSKLTSLIESGKIKVCDFAPVCSERAVTGVISCSPTA